MEPFEVFTAEFNSRGDVTVLTWTVIRQTKKFYILRINGFERQELKTSAWRTYFPDKRTAIVALVYQQEAQILETEQQREYHTRRLEKAKKALEEVGCAIPG